MTWALMTLAVVVGLISVLATVLGRAAMGHRTHARQRKGAMQRYMERP